MIQLRNLQWWTGALLFTLMISIVIFAYVARRPLCIDSKIVERIDSVSSAGTATAYRCALRKHVAYDEALSQQMPELNRRLQKLERFFDLMGPLRVRLSLTILRGGSDLYRIQGREIFLGDSVLKSEGQLEKTFLKAWFRERAHSDLIASNLIEESLTDFLYFALNGDLSFQDVKTKVSLSQEIPPRWPRVLTNWSGYCRSLWRSTEDLKLCEDLKSFSDDGIHLMSLRSLITESMIASYSDLSASEQMAFLRGFTASLDELSFHEKNFGLSPVELKKQSYFDAVSQLENWSFFISNLSSKVPFADKLAVLFDLELKKRGFDRATQKTVLDTLVFAEALNATQKKSILSEMDRLPNLLTGLESRGTLQMTQTGEPLNLKLLGSVQATSGVYLHCGAPDLKKISEYSKRVEKLLYVHFCGDQVVFLKGYFEKGVQKFAQQNPGLKFAEFHLPSLMLALQKLPGQNPIQLLSEKKKDSLNSIGWKEPVYDEISNSYRAQSAIEMVNYFRL